MVVVGDGVVGDGVVGDIVGDVVGGCVLLLVMVLLTAVVSVVLLLEVSCYYHQQQFPAVFFLISFCANCHVFCYSPCSVTVDQQQNSKTHENCQYHIGNYSYQQQLPTTTVTLSPPPAAPISLPYYGQQNKNKITH